MKTLKETRESEKYYEIIISNEVISKVLGISCEFHEMRLGHIYFNCNLDELRDTKFWKFDLVSFSLPFYKINIDTFMRIAIEEFLFNNGFYVIADVEDTKNGYIRTLTLINYKISNFEPREYIIEDGLINRAKLKLLEDIVGDLK